MKKIIIIIIISAIFINLNNTIKEEKAVFNQYEEEQYFILEFPYRNLSTNNLYILNNLKIIWIEPYIINKKYYYYNDKKFKEAVFNDLKKNNNNLALNYKISGIPIKKIKIFGFKSKIKQINIDNILINS